MRTKRGIIIICVFSSAVPSESFSLLCKMSSSDCSNRFGWHFCQLISTDRVRSFLSHFFLFLVCLFCFLVFLFSTSSNQAVWSQFQSTNSNSGVINTFRLSLLKVFECDQYDDCLIETISSWERGSYKCSSTGQGLVADYTFLLLFSLCSLLLSFGSARGWKIPFPRFLAIGMRLLCVVLAIIPIVAWLDHCQSPITGGDFYIFWLDGSHSAATNVGSGGAMGFAAGAFISSIFALVSYGWLLCQPENPPGQSGSEPPSQYVRV